VLRWLISRRLLAIERELGESLDYLRVMLRASLAAFFQFVKLTGVSRYRKVLPVPAFHLVQMLAAKHEDCGSCLQTTVTLAKRAGVASPLLTAVIAGKPDDLPEEFADLYRFVERVLRASHDEAELREKIRARYAPRGDAALSEIALVLCSSRSFPVTKRVLGFATSCSQVKVDV
jgi:hypothetical protein